MTRMVGFYRPLHTGGRRYSVFLSERQQASTNLLTRRQHTDISTSCKSIAENGPLFSCEAWILRQRPTCRWVVSSRSLSSSSAGKSRHPRGSNKPLRNTRQRGKQQSSQVRETQRSNATKDTQTVSTTSNTTKQSNYVPWTQDPIKQRAYKHAKWMAVAQRATPLVLIGLAINLTGDTGEEFFGRYISPLAISPTYGPSMVPTIHPYGDIWLHTTPLWDSIRGIYYKLKSIIVRKPQFLYNRGDVIIWRHPVTQYRACKRITGIEGDTVQCYGQFVEYYRHRDDLEVSANFNKSVGLEWDINQHASSSPSSTEGGEDAQIEVKHTTTGNQKETKNIYRTITVPLGHVWVEGDNPLLSLDSRHYGPVPVEYLEGRLVWRLWPLLRHVEIRKHDQLLLRHRHIRPQPLDVETPKQRGEEDRLALYYNLHRRRPPPPQRQHEHDHHHHDPTTLQEESHLESQQHQ